MNLLGKSLIVLIFVMSIFFMASSVMVFATHQNYKERYEAEQKKFQEQQNRNSELQGERDKLERQLALERAARTQTTAALQAQFQQQSEELSAKQRQLENVQGNAHQLATAVQAAVQAVDGLQKQVDAQKTELISLREDHRAKFETVMQITDENNQLEAMLQRIETQARQLRDQLATAQRVLEHQGLESTAPVTGVAPRAQGRVTDVRDNRVIVSLGSDDGIRVGHEMDVSRGERYLGRIRIVRTTTDRAVGEVLEGLRRGAIQRDDRVRTQAR